MRSLLLSLSLVLAPIAAAGGAASAQTAAAEAAPPVLQIAAPPVGWIHDTAHADTVRRGLVAGFPDDAPGAEVRVESFRPPEPGAQLILSRAWFPAPADPATLVRERVEDLRRTVEVMSSGGADGLRQIGWQERSDDAGRLVEATLEWAHDGNQTLSMVRAVWVKLPDALAEYRVECVMTLDAVAAIRPACQQAMASLMLPAMAQRQPLAVAPPAVPDADEDPLDDRTGATAAPGPVQPGIRPAPDGVAPVVLAQPPRAEPPRDLRPFWLAGGLLLVAAALWWSNARRKKVLDADDADAARRDAEPVGPDELDADLTGAPDPESELDAEAATEPESDRKEDRPT